MHRQNERCTRFSSKNVLTNEFVKKMNDFLQGVVTMTPLQVAALQIDPQTNTSRLYPNLHFFWSIDYINLAGTFITSRPYKYPSESFTARYKVFATTLPSPYIEPADEDPRNEMG